MAAFGLVMISLLIASHDAARPRSEHDSIQEKLYQEYLGNLSEFWRLYNSSLSARNQSRMYAGRQPTHSVLVELKHMELKRGGSQDARQDHVSPQDCEAMTHGHALEILLRQFCKKIGSFEREHLAKADEAFHDADGKLEEWTNAGSAARQAQEKYSHTAGEYRDAMQSNLRTVTRVLREHLPPAWQNPNAHETIEIHKAEENDSAGGETASAESDTAEDAAAEDAAEAEAAGLAAAEDRNDAASGVASPTEASSAAPFGASPEDEKKSAVKTKKDELSRLAVKARKDTAGDAAAEHQDAVEAKAAGLAAAGERSEAKSEVASPTEAEENHSAGGETASAESDTAEDAAAEDQDGKTKATTEATDVHGAAPTPDKHQAQPEAPPVASGDDAAEALANIKVPKASDGPTDDGKAKEERKELAQWPPHDQEEAEKPEVGWKPPQAKDKGKT